MSADTQRQAALRVLTRVRRDNAWIHSALESDKRVAQMPPRERSFVTVLTRGTIEHLGTLDVMIDRAADRPSGIEPRVRDALRIAVYEILYLSTPDRAAVNEGVELVRSVQPRAAGLANAVLRKVAQSAEDQPFGDVDDDFDAFALFTGHPGHIAHMLHDDLGEEGARLVMTADENPAPLYLACNPFLVEFDSLIAELDRQGCEPRACDIPGSIVCDSPAQAVASDAVRDGRAVVCDLAAQAIVAATPLVPGQILFDAAAGRGTKTMLLQARAMRAGGEARIVAADVHEFKTRLLAKRMTDLHVPGIRVAEIDSRDPVLTKAILGDTPDAVFVDAPCSGLGTLRRHPEKRWRLTLDDIAVLAGLSGQLLDTALRVVRPGGFVVYSTCTLTCAENTDLVRSTIASLGHECEMVSFEDLIAPSMARWVTPDGSFQSLPEPGGPDGHFAAIIRRLS